MALSLAGAAGLCAGGVALMLGYSAYVTPSATPAQAGSAPATPARTAAPQPAPTVLSAGRPMPMPAPEPDAAPRPARAAGSGRQASAMRSPDGHFYFDAFVNGSRLRTMFDTGATHVSLTAEDAKRIGLSVNSLEYNVPVSTANGRAMMAYVVLGSVRIGDITKRNIPALVSRPGAAGMTLLGQGFISRVTSYRHERSELILMDD